MKVNNGYDATLDASASKLEGNLKFEKEERKKNGGYFLSFFLFFLFLYF